MFSDDVNFHSRGTTNVLHREHGVHEKFKPAHVDPARSPVLVHLDRIEIVAQKSAHVFENAVLWLKKINPGEEVQNQIALGIVCLLKHVQLGVRLADGFPMFCQFA